MSSYPDLGPTGQEYIAEEEYKALYGYPNGKVNNNLAAEVPGTSRPFILENQLYSQEIPIPAPSNLGATQTKSIGSVNVNYKVSQTSTLNYLVYYIDIVLSNAELSTADDGGALTWWFIGANIGNAETRANQVTYNILNQGVPNNLDPQGSYLPTLKINGTTYNFGNSQYPWTYNVNSGIILFTGSAIYTGTGTADNNTPLPSDNITFSFWRYEGLIGMSGGGGDTIWQVSTNPNTISPVSTYQNYTITGTQFKSTSDYRIKTDIQELDSNYHNVDNLRPVIYKQVQNNNLNIGLIAHELQEYFPFLVDGEKDGEKTQSVNYIGLIGVLIKEIQDLKKRVNKLENEKIIE